MRIIPSLQLWPNWFRKVFQLLWPRWNRNLFGSGILDTVREKGKKRLFTQSCATMSPLFHLPAVGGNSLSGKQASGPACGIHIHGFWGRVAPMPVMLGSPSAWPEHSFHRDVRWEAADSQDPLSWAGFSLWHLQFYTEDITLSFSCRTVDWTRKCLHFCSFPLAGVPNASSGFPEEWGQSLC